ncbi:SNF5-domain-containing protein [Trametes gibbosa]|nr:SNF5-domain-containing protein [Trametes gibbosa]
MALPPHSSRQPLPTTPQALQSTYASRLRTGTTLLVQPILAPSSVAAVASRTSRRGGVVNYTEPGSGDEFPDAGALESDDSDFVASGGTRQAVRAARLSSRAPVGSSVFHAGTGMTMSPAVASPVQQPQKEKTELDQSYLGQLPPTKFITAKPMLPTRHDYFPQVAVDTQAEKPTALIPIRVEFETETQRIRDCFVWNLNEALITPETFARIFCTDLDLPLQPWVETIAAQMRAQIEDHEGVATTYLGADAEMAAPEDESPGDEVNECRVLLSIDVQIATHHLLDHIEWDLLSPLTPEEFSVKLCTELGLAGEAAPLISHAIHEELVKHKRDAIEWGVIGGETRDTAADEGTPGAERPRDKSGQSLLKDKTGLGLAWGRAPKDGRGPKPLRSVWRDWAEAEEFRTRFEVLTAEEVERRELERERASRRLRRETSKFQSTVRSRRR